MLAILDYEADFEVDWRLLAALTLTGQAADGVTVGVFCTPSYANYTRAALAAQWSLTNGIRLELASQGTQVTGLHLGAADTDISAGYDGEKVDPADVVRAALEGIEAGKIEVLVDAWSSHVKASLAADPSQFYPQTVPAA